MTFPLQYSKNQPRVWEGYVSFLPNRGFTCNEIRLQEAQALYERRESREAFAVENTVEKLTYSSFEEPRQRQAIRELRAAASI